MSKECSHWGSGTGQFDPPRPPLTPPGGAGPPILGVWGPSEEPPTKRSGGQKPPSSEFSFLCPPFSWYFFQPSVYTGPQRQQARVTDSKSKFEIGRSDGY